MELRTRLTMAFSAEVAPAVPVPTALEDNPDPIVDAPSEKRPRVDRELAAAPKDVLLGGKKHMARLEDITMKPPKTKDALLPKTSDVFGSTSRREMEAAM